VARTAETLKHILGINSAETREERYAYDNGQEMSVFRGMYHQQHQQLLLPFVLCAKDENRGKRDSLVLVRRLCLRYNTSGVSWIFGRVFWGQKIDYIIGLDADTTLADECAYHLIEGIEANTNIYGCVGYVDVAGAREGGWRRYLPFNWYQYAEYMFAQCLKRQAQSCLTGKVSCLSGCNQILRVAEETCGEDLLKVFNRQPAPNEDILTQIRAYASEDRNHVGLMLSMYPHVQTTQALQATAYTQVPQSVAVFLSQRRRWNLGAGANDLLLVTLPHINVFERISAAVNVLTYAVNPFIFVATIWFLKALLTNPTMLILYLSIIMLIPLCYIVLIPIFVRPLPFREALYFYGGMLLFLSTGTLVNLATYFYSLTYMDEISWGKTRRLQPQPSQPQPQPSESTLPVVNLMTTARESYV
jgi:chitin synthase